MGDIIFESTATGGHAWLYSCNSSSEARYNQELTTTANHIHDLPAGQVAAVTLSEECNRRIRSMDGSGVIHPISSD
jgi:hypothetical protein